MKLFFLIINNLRVLVWSSVFEYGCYSVASLGWDLQLLCGNHLNDQDVIFLGLKREEMEGLSSLNVNNEVPNQIFYF